MAVELHSRAGITGLVSDALNREGKRDTPPLILLLGHGGTGKTALLDGLEADHKKYRPLARLDLASFETDDLAMIMSSISSQLRHGSKPAVKPALPLLDTGVDFIRGGKTKSKSTAQHLEWYQRLFRQDPDLQARSLPELRDQWRAALDADDQAARIAARADLWRALCSGFLADLRREFDTRTIRHDRRTTNCVLLLDNADTQNGVGLLEALAGCRETAGGASDPLLVIAAQRTWPELRPGVGAIISSADEGLRDAAGKREEEGPDAAPSPWTPVRLAGLPASGIAKIVHSRFLGAARYDQRFVYEVTNGHPAAAWEMARELQAPRPGTPPRDLVTSSVEDVLLDLLRPDSVSDQELLALAVYCLPLKPEPGAATQVFRSVDWDDVSALNVEKRLLSLMWARRDKDRLSIDPLARLLLTRRLARDADLWEKAHQILLKRYRDNEDNEQNEEVDPALVRYHQLALVTSLPATNVHTISAYLDRFLPPQDQEESGSADPDGKYLSAAEWDRILADITSAPSRLRQALGGRTSPVLHPQARDVVAQIAGARDPASRERTIARLVTALWLYNDRTFDPGHRLAGLISDEYQELAKAVRGDCGALYTRAWHFQEVAGDWKDAR